MMHRRLTTAGIEVAPHYHQLLVHQNRMLPRFADLHAMNSGKSCCGSGVYGSSGVFMCAMG